MLKLKSALTGVAAAAVLAAVPTVVMAKTDNGNSNAHNKITICHATGSATNPYVVITPDANGVVSGHYAHQDNRDIIPSFQYNDHGTTKTFPGQNLGNGGQAILDNNCVVTTSGGQGGGPSSTPTGGQVLGSTSGGSQVSAVPQGSANGGEGGLNDFSMTTLNRAW